MNRLHFKTWFNLGPGLLLFLSLFCPCRFAGGQDLKLARKAEKIHRAVLTIDSHTDTPLKLMQKGFNITLRHDPKMENSKIDFPRMKEGGLDGIFFAVFISQGPRNTETYENVRKKAIALFDTIHDVVTRFPDQAGLALTPRDAVRLKHQGKRAVFIGIENGYAIGKDLSLISTYYLRGARYITLCHTKNNDICDSSTDTVENNGLSPFGYEVVREMNELGLMVDVSHISDKAVMDVLSYAKTPVIASHSCAKALCNNRRNLSDELLKAIADKGGVIQMCILSNYVKAPEKKPSGEKVSQPLATVSDVVDHIDHMVKIAGIDHVGIGTDFDGGGGVTGCFDVSEMGNITLELVKRGYSRKGIRKIWGGNLMRVMNQTEKVARAYKTSCHCNQ